MATKVTLRQKAISGNRQSLYLDFYPAIPHPETGEPTRREFLGQGNKEEGNYDNYLEEIKKALPKNFKPKGDFYVLVDECHRTQSGDLNKAMRSILGDNALFIGFTGTPILKTEKKKSIEIFGKCIHTYKFDEAVKDGVVLDLRYEARDIEQKINSLDKIDEWFDRLR